MKKFSLFSLFFVLFVFGFQSVLFAQSAIWNGTTNTAWFTDAPAGTTVFDIANAEELAGFAHLVDTGTTFEGMTVRLMNDIVLNDTANWRNWGTSLLVTLRPWTPIGTSSTNSFRGTFDGQGRRVIGVYINNPTLNRQGLFGIVGEGGIIQNVGVESSFVGGRSDVGGIVGWNRGTVTNSYNTGEVTGNYWVGGIVGWNNGGTVNSSFNTGAVSGNNYVGGIVGGNDGAVNSSFFLEGTALQGVGAGPAGGTSRTQAQFTSGEVAHLLQVIQANLIWGHTVLGGAELPMLAFQDTSVTQVRRVLFASTDPAYSGTHYFLNSTLLVSPIQRLGYSAVWRDPDGNEYTHTTRVLSDLVLTFNRWEIYTTVQREPDFSVKLGPNPIQDELIVTITGASEYIGKTVRLSVFDLNGRRFASETIEINGVYDEKTVAVSSLSAGVCVLVLEVEGFDAKRLVFTKVER